MKKEPETIKTATNLFYVYMSVSLYCVMKLIFFFYFAVLPRYFANKRQVPKRILVLCIVYSLRQIFESIHSA